ncbi:hypothetical protein CRG98_001987 [Punica granatum]|uniref:Uncharacterized protein n=1 Tax=Punica granatum TaxID=22663 RepID=A0A2I0LAD5_PUNGR|nr:hypothetical protein CRG98_001987 [Punica granatum]
MQVRKVNVHKINVRKAINKHASKANEIEPKPIKYVPSGVAKLYGPECALSSGPACALLDRAAWEYPSSRGCMTDTSEKESPLTILRPEGRGPKRETTQYGPPRPVTGADQFLGFSGLCENPVKAEDLVDLSRSDLKGTSVFRHELPEIRAATFVVAGVWRRTCAGVHRHGKELRRTVGRAGRRARVTSTGRRAGRTGAHGDGCRDVCGSNRARARARTGTRERHRAPGHRSSDRGVLFTREHDPNLK